MPLSSSFALLGAAVASLVGGQSEPTLQVTPAGPDVEVVTPLRNVYRQVNLVANSAAYKPVIVDPLLVNGWGIAIRPPGAGGHFWINNAVTGTSTTYVGDVGGVPISQDELLYVTVPNTSTYANQPEALSQPTGIVYTGRSSTDFMVSGEGITGASKFIFVGLEGGISGWTTGQQHAVLMVDSSLQNSWFSGCAVTEQASGNRLYVADLGSERKVRVYNHLWQEIQTAGNFSAPDIDDTRWSVHNIQFLDGKLFAAIGFDDDDDGEVEGGYPGFGYICEFDLEGRWLATYEHVLALDAPWGFAIAPANFGAMSNLLLVSNFGDGTIIGFDRTTRKFVDYMRDERGEPVAVEGIWGILFGNGTTLGEANHLYFAAGPNQELDGLFGKFMPVNAPGGK